MKLLASLLVACLLSILVACGGESPSGSVFNAGMLVDGRDGQSYRTVVIGKQVWMAENLNYETERSFCYDDDPANCAKYGRLYSWADAIDMPEDECGYGRECELGDVEQGVCPVGWHLPTDEEFETLVATVGGKETAARMLKSDSGWAYDKGMDSYGFSGLPAGCREYNETYQYKGERTWFWTSTARQDTYAYFMAMWYIDDDVGIGISTKEAAFSVRCVKN